MEFGGKGDGGPQGRVVHGLMVLYLFDWVASNLINFRFLDKVDVFVRVLRKTMHHLLFSCLGLEF